LRALLGWNWVNTTTTSNPLHVFSSPRDSPPLYLFQVAQLPIRVGRMFLADDSFFSDTMRNRIPEMLFKNGSSGLERMFSPMMRPASAQQFHSSSFPFEIRQRSESPASIVRHVPIRVNVRKRRRLFSNLFSRMEVQDSFLLDLRLTQQQIPIQIDVPPAH
jgi:hypothetical protein